MNIDNLAESINYLKNNSCYIEEYKELFINYFMKENTNIDEILILFINSINKNLTKDISINRNIYLNILLTLYLSRKPENKDINKYIFYLIYTIVKIDKIIYSAPNIGDPTHSEFLNNFQETVNELFKDDSFRNINMVESARIFINIFTS